VTDLLKVARRRERAGQSSCWPSAPELLGESVALLRDPAQPDDLVVGGQAFNPSIPRVCKQVEEA